MSERRWRLRDERAHASIGTVTRQRSVEQSVTVTTEAPSAKTTIVPERRSLVVPPAVGVSMVGFSF
ncbi:MAG TPA: hypothetical protein VLM85_10805 [Polyangiaceae bacterium]|nr:hypothetical protein [Polyangiaceae bacterium]